MSLTTSNQWVVDTEAGGQGRTLDIGHCAVISVGETLLGDIESGIDRCTKITETARAHVDVECGCRSYGIRIADGQGMGVIRLCAAILAEPGAEGVARQVS